jgi:hypothetical protein
MFKFDLQPPLAAQSNLRVGAEGILQVRVLEIFPRVLHVQCHAHVLNLALRYSLRHTGTYEVNFYALNAIANIALYRSKKTYFFSENLKRKCPS